MYKLKVSKKSKKNHKPHQDIQVKHHDDVQHKTKQGQLPGIIFPRGTKVGRSRHTQRKRCQIAQRVTHAKKGRNLYGEHKN